MWVRSNWLNADVELLPYIDYMPLTFIYWPQKKCSKGEKKYSLTDDSGIDGSGWLNARPSSQLGCVPGKSLRLLHAFPYHGLYSSFT